MATANDQAVAILDPEQTSLLRAVDQAVTGWAADIGAPEIIAPPIYPITDLAKFDVYKNFPHLLFAASPLDVTDAMPEPTDGGLDTDDLRRAVFGLPHATCYGAYLYFEGSSVPADTTVTLLNRCFRNENRYEGLRRLLSFQMREVVAIGSYEHTQEIIAHFTEKIRKFAAALSLDLEKAGASDPFFRNDDGRALLQKLSPLKYEFIADDLAIASVNTHRNFFGERCGIKISGKDEHAYTSCVAFGLERWLSVLTDRYNGDLGRALDAVNGALA
jgi:hypothetical protein